jgi:hypothetical protein
MRQTWIVAAMAALVLLILLYAWIDGGREPLRPISERVPIPTVSAPEMNAPEIGR